MRRTFINMLCLAALGALPFSGSIQAAIGGGTVVEAAMSGNRDAVRSLLARLDKYAQTGNTEYLMDAANFAMIEFMHPKHPDAHFEATDSKGSPGRQFHGEVDRSQRGNREI